MNSWSFTDDCLHLLQELCGKGGILLLAQAVVNLKISPFYSETSPYMATVSGLKSKALSIVSPSDGYGLP